MSGQLLFVYGTLKRGQSANNLLGEAEFVGPAATEPLYRLVDLGTHPGLIAVESGGISVQGELWRIDRRQIPVLDRYEGAPTEYARRDIRLRNCDESVVSYFYLGDSTRLPVCGTEWPRPNDGNGG